jgi:hypothetical protein
VGFPPVLAGGVVSIISLKSWPALVEFRCCAADCALEFVPNRKDKNPIAVMNMLRFNEPSHRLTNNSKTRVARELR